MSLSASAKNKLKASIAGAVIVVAAGYIGYQFARRGPLPNKLRFVCAETGKTFWLGRDEVLEIPSKNPETGAATLFPCGEKEGALRVSARHQDALIALGERNRYVDTETLAVRAPK